MSSERKRLCVIGAGRAGSALALALSRRGWRIAAVASRRLATARRLAHACGAKLATTDPVRAAAAADAVLISVPDREIPGLSSRLAQRRPHGARAGTPHSRARAHTPDKAHRIYLHTAGASGASILSALRSHGYRVGSFHPLLALSQKRYKQGARGTTTNRRPSERGVSEFEGATFAIDGDPAARALARRLAASLGGRAVLITAEHRARYHLAACLASNYLVTLVAEAVDLMAKAGIPRRRALPALLPLIHSTVLGLERSGLPGALTGPVSRGDATTVARHAAELRLAPADLRVLHRGLVLRAARLARQAGWIDEETSSRIARSLGRTRRT